jgi:uncharacterized protein (TIGR02246 family)
MNRRQAVFCAMAGIATMGSDGKAMGSDGALAAKVERLATRYAVAWNASDMDAMSALYAKDVHWVNIVGMHWRGKPQVDRAHRAFFDIMFRGVPLSLEEVESIKLLPGGCVVVVIRWSVGAFKTPSGGQIPPSRDRMSLVLVPDGTDLLIAHGANIQIDEMAQRSNPIN